MTFKISKPKHHKHSQMQALPDLVSNEIVYQSYWNNKLLTAKQIANLINDRLGRRYTEEDVKATEGTFSSNVTTHKGKLVTREMLAFPDYYLYIKR